MSSKSEKDVDGPVRTWLPPMCKAPDPSGPGQGQDFKLCTARHVGYDPTDKELAGPFKKLHRSASCNETSSQEALGLGAAQDLHITTRGSNSTTDGLLVHGGSTGFCRATSLLT